MTRRLFFGFIPALLAAAKWPIEKLRGLQHSRVWSNSYLATQEMLDDAVVPTGWLEEKLRSEIDHV